MKGKPDCYRCKYRQELTYDAHSSCSNKTAEVTGDQYGVNNGWFSWPWNFDPVWLETCTGFSGKESL